MAVTSTEGFLDVLKESELLSADDYQKAVQLVGSTTEPKKVALKLVDAGLLSRWQAGQMLKGRKALSLGKYLLIDRLDWGNSRTTFLARHKTMDRRVALKVLEIGKGKSREAEKRFLAEAQAVAAIDHRHIIHVYDVDDENDHCYLVMEYVDGSSLQDRVAKDGPLSPEATANFLAQVADGLAYAHKHGSVHGGLRPANVLIDDKGTAKILDFGVSRLTEFSSHGEANDDSRILAMADYLSPEQSADAEQATAKSDLYALGCTGYFLLAGQAPFTLGGVAQRLASHRDEAPPALSEFRADVPAELTAIIEKLMQKDPAERYASAQEAAKELNAWREKYLAELEAAKPRPKAKPPIANAASATPPPSRTPTAPLAPATKKIAPAKKPTIAAATSPAKTPSAGSPVEKFTSDKPAGGKPPAAKGPGAKPGLKQAAALPEIGPPAEIGPPTEAVEEAAATDDEVAMPFSINTKSSGKKTKPAAAGPAINLSSPAAKKSPGKAAASKAKANAATDGEAATTEKKKLPLGLILGAAGGALVLLLLVGGAAAFVFWPRGNTQVAKAPAVEASPDDAAKTSTEKDADDKKTEEVKKETAEPEKPEPSLPIPGGAVPEGQGANGAVGGGTSPAPTENTAEPKAGEPVAGEPAVPEAPLPEPENPQPAAPKPNKPKPAAPKPKPAEPKPKPEPPAAPVNYFAAFPKLTPLPLPNAEGAKEAIQLGTLSVPKDIAIYVDLLGGEKAIRSGGKFTLDRARGGLAERDWEIRYQPNSGDAAIVADLKLTENDLQFQWRPEATNLEAAGYLQNCMIELRTADHGHKVTLRQPVSAPAVQVNLERAQMREKFEIPFAPDPESIQVQITALESEITKFTLAPKERLAALKDTSMMGIDEADKQIILLKIDTAMNKGDELQINFSPMLKTPGQPAKFSVKEIARLEQQQLIMSQQLMAQVEMLKKKKLDKQAAAADLQLKSITDTLEQIDKLKSQFEKLNKKALVQYRVFYVDGNNEIDLALSVAPGGIEVDVGGERGINLGPGDDPE